jgi:hypothetical protein
MLQKENQEPLAGGLLAGVQQADAVDYPRNGEESQGARDPAQLAVIRKNALEEIRVGLSDFNGHDLLNIRIWAEPRNGGVERIPTKAGICCNVRLLPDLIAALQKAEVAARQAGLLP